MTVRFRAILLSFVLVFALSACSSGRKAVNASAEQNDKITAMVIDAAVQKEIGNIDEAIAIYEKIIELQENNSLAYYQLSALNFEKRNVASAIEYNEKAIELSPKNHWYREQLAEIYRQIRQLDKAAEQYEKLLKQNPDADEYYSELSDLYFNAGKYDKTIAVLNRMEKRRGVSEATSMLKYKLYQQIQQPDKAKKEMERLSNSFPQNVDYLSVLAQAAVQSGDKAKAYSYFKKIEAISPEDENNTIALIEYYAAKNMPDSLEMYISRLCLNKDVDFSTKNMVMLSIYKDDVDQKPDVFAKYLAHLESMRELHSEQAELWQFLNIGYMRNQNYVSATLTAKRCIELGTNDYQTYQNLLFSQSTCEPADSIIATADKAIRLFPQQAVPYLFKGVNQLVNKDYEGAIKTLSDGLASSRDNKALMEDFYLNLADAYHESGNNDKSYEYYQKVVDLNPDNIPALNNYAYYLSLENRDIEKAEAMAEKAHKAQPDNITYADTYAWVLYVAGKHSQALQVFEAFLHNQAEWNETVKQHYETIKQSVGR